MEDPATPDATLTVRSGEAAAPPLSPPAAATPTQHVTAAALKTVNVKDALGRSITVRKLTALHKLDLAVVIGAENVRNPMVYGVAAVAYAVQAIDGDPVLPPNSYAELRGLVGRLEDEGLAAVQDAMVEHFGETPLTEADVAGQVKNS